MLWLPRLERKNKKIIQSISNLHISLSFLLIWNWNDKYVHTLRSSLENHTRFQTKMGKVYTRFQTKTALKPYLIGGGTYLSGLYKGVPSPGPWISSDGTWRGWSKDFFEFKFSIPGFFWMPAYPGPVVLRIKSTKHVFKNFAFRVISFNAFWKFLRLGNTAWNFIRG